jgi:hypothetical protein
LTTGTKFNINVILDRGATFLDPMNVCKVTVGSPNIDQTKYACSCIFSVKTATIKRCVILFEAFDYFYSSIGFNLWYS